MKKRRLDDPRVIFGNQLRFLRTKKRWTQENLAFEVGLDRTYISGIERGQRNVSLLNIFKLARTLEISLPQFFDFSEMEKDQEKR